MASNYERFRCHYRSTLSGMVVVTSNKEQRSVAGGSALLVNPKILMI